MVFLFLLFSTKLCAKLYKIIGKERILVNSRHKTAIKATKLEEVGVSVDGVVITELGTKVDNNSSIMIDGKSLTREEKEYVLLYKPRGVVTTTNDDKKRKKTGKKKNPMLLKIMFIPPKIIDTKTTQPIILISPSIYIFL